MLGWPATKQDGWRAEITASRSPSASNCDRLLPSAAAESGKPAGRIERKLVVAAESLEPALHPFDVARRDGEFVAQEAAHPHRGRHLILGDADALLPKVCRAVNSPIGPDVDCGMAKHARQECRDGRISSNAARQGDQIGAEADLRDLEFPVQECPLQDLLHRHGDVVDVAAFDPEAAVGQRSHAIIVPRRYRDRQPAHARLDGGKSRSVIYETYIRDHCNGPSRQHAASQGCGQQVRRCHGGARGPAGCSKRFGGAAHRDAHRAGLPCDRGADRDASPQARRHPFRADALGGLQDRAHPDPRGFAAIGEGRAGDHSAPQGHSGLRYQSAPSALVARGPSRARAPAVPRRRRTGDARAAQEHARHCARHGPGGEAQRRHLLHAARPRAQCPHDRSGAQRLCRPLDEAAAGPFATFLVHALPRGRRSAIVRAAACRGGARDRKRRSRRGSAPKR